MKEKTHSPELTMGYGLILGLVAGVLIGQGIQDVALGTAIGSGIGLTIGALVCHMKTGSEIKSLDSLKLFLGGLIIIQIIILTAAFIVYRLVLVG